MTSKDTAHPFLQETLEVAVKVKLSRGIVEFTQKKTRVGWIQIPKVLTHKMALAEIRWVSR